MKLAIDIGNSWAKCAVIEGQSVVEVLRTEVLDKAYIEKIFLAYPQIQSAILLSCRESQPELEQLLRDKTEQFILFDSMAEVPIKNLYLWPQSLGADRLAAAVGASTLYPKENVLVVDFGTAITIDLVSQRGEFIGGNISPGAATRFRALHQFTDKLPLRVLVEDTGDIGRTTNEAVENGVINGIVYEIEGYIREFSLKYPNLRVLFTGGESDFFVKRFKNTIFANCDLVLFGLNRILEYNAK